MHLRELDQIRLSTREKSDRLPSVSFILRRSRPARLGVHVLNPPGQIKGMISKFP